ncbi:hypothetical protein NPIL_672581 [Nephila pilipes]|uniref:Uncharacterized protein n=1 Tax=Nephila pilipes TaxID=299642 RepID=A0A8X6PEN2_NEPPI|nr:hypothetical protein NPIL_672581 [Nephila pilipes]
MDIWPPGQGVPKPPEGTSQNKKFNSRKVDENISYAYRRSCSEPPRFRGLGTKRRLTRKSKTPLFHLKLLGFDSLQAIELLQNLAKLLNKFPALLNILENENNKNVKNKRIKKVCPLKSTF